jgi:hypothetical protein
MMLGANEKHRLMPPLFQTKYLVLPASIYTIGMRAKRSA